MYDSDHDELMNLIAEYGEEQLIRYLADSLIHKQSIINLNRN